MAKGLELDWVVIRVNTIRRLLAVVVIAVVAAGLVAYTYYQINPSPEVRAKREIQHASTAQKQVAESEKAKQREREIAEATAKLTQAKEAYSNEKWDIAYESAKDAKNVFLGMLGEGGRELPGAGKIKTSNGRVRVQRAGTKVWIEASDDMRLYNGDFVQSENGTAEISFNDGTEFRIEPGSLLEVHQESRRSGSSGKVIFRSGQINIHTGDAQSIVETVSTETKIESDSRVTVNVEEDKKAIVGVHDGTAVVTNPKGEQMVVGTREQIAADVTGTFSEKKAIPEPPLPLDPRNNRMFDIAKHPIIELSWRPTKAEYVYLQVSRSKSFFSDQLDVDAKLNQRNEARLRAVTPGTYYWRVAAGSEERKESEWSSTSLFQIIDPTKRHVSDDKEPPALELTRTQQLGHIVIIEGTTEAGATVTINDEPVEVASDGQFRKTVELTKEGRSELVIIATDPSGNNIRQTLPVFVEF